MRLGPGLAWPGLARPWYVIEPASPVCQISVVIYKTILWVHQCYAEMKFLFIWADPAQAMPSVTVISSR